MNPQRKTEPERGCWRLGCLGHCLLSQVELSSASQKPVNLGLTVVFLCSKLKTLILKVQDKPENGVPDHTLREVSGEVSMLH